MRISRRFWPWQTLRHKAKAGASLHVVARSRKRFADLAQRPTARYQSLIDRPLAAPAQVHRDGRRRFLCTQRRGDGCAEFSRRLISPGVRLSGFRTPQWGLWKSACSAEGGRGRRPEQAATTSLSRLSSRQALRRRSMGLEAASILFSRTP